jgi:hypothetical protein
MLGAELPVLPDDVADEVRAHFGSLTAWLESVLDSAARGKRVKLTASVQAEAATLVSLIYGAMLAARAYGAPHCSRKSVTARWSGWLCSAKPADPRDAWSRDA